MSRPYEVSWAADGPVSLPEPLETTDTEMADFGGFCFTPDGLRVNVSRTDREQVLARGFRPPQER